MTMRTDSPLWAITSYFNPFRGQRRRANYHVFRRHLGVPLVTVEWSPDGAFELNGDDAEILVRVSGGDLMWQKECLLNVALRRLPRSCRFVAWLDCDIVFADRQWAEQAVAQLDRHHWLQLFSEARYLPPLLPDDVDAALAGDPERLPLFKGLVAQVLDGAPLYTRCSETTTLAGSPGLGLAARRDWLERAGLYDGGIVGGADRMLIVQLMGRADESWAVRPMTPGQTRHFHQWSRRLEAAPPMSYGHLDGVVFHLYHGEIASRRYQYRHQILLDCGYDPAVHLVRAPQGVWCWSPEAGELRQQVLAYLTARNDA